MSDTKVISETLLFVKQSLITAKNQLDNLEEISKMSKEEEYVQSIFLLKKAMIHNYNKLQIKEKMLENYLNGDTTYTIKEILKID